MPKKYPLLTPDEVIRILLARGFVWDHSRGSHEYYAGDVRGKLRTVTVDTHYREFDVDLLTSMLDQSGLTRQGFYGFTRSTAKKIGIRAKEYPIPLKD